MNNKYLYDETISECEFYPTDDEFYHISDNRTWKSNIQDINGGDNFAEYCEYIFRLYEDEEIDYSYYYENNFNN